MYIVKEIPTWAINWVNKVFTLLNTPSQVDDVFVNGLVTTAYTLVWSVITFTTAPIYSVLVDYTTWTTTAIDYWQDTFIDIKNEIWDLLWTTSASTIFTSAKIWKKINAKIMEVSRWRITSLINPQTIYKSWKLDFLDEKIGFRIQGWWILTAILNIWDITGYLDTTNIYPAWYLQIGWDVVKYTWVTPTTITWVIWQTVEHLVADTCIQLYQMPTDFERVKIVNKVVNWYNFEIPFDASESLTICYTIYKYWDTQLIKIKWLTVDDLINIEYTKRIYDLVNDADLCILPNYYWTKVIAPLVAWEYALQRWIPNYQWVLSSWYTGLQNMYQFYCNPTNDNRTVIKAKAYNFNSLRR
jgi:hypothetical protein